MYVPIFFVHFLRLFIISIKEIPKENQFLVRHTEIRGKNIFFLISSWVPRPRKNFLFLSFYFTISNSIINEHLCSLSRDLGPSKFVLGCLVNLWAMQDWNLIKRVDFKGFWICLATIFSSKHNFFARKLQNSLNLIDTTIAFNISFLSSM